MASSFLIGPLGIDPPLIQAPMAGFTNYAYRRMIRRLGGVGLTVTEMVSARGFWHTLNKGSRNHYLGGKKVPGTILVDDNEQEEKKVPGTFIEINGEDSPERLWGVRDEERPLAVQIWDNDPEAMAVVARRLVEEYRPSAIDINFGCPARDVSEKAQSGAYLLRDPDRVGEIVARVAAACRPVPVTAKIRLGLTRDAINAIDVAQAVEASGGAAVTVHGRTAAERYRGSADWDEIARIKPHLHRIPLIGNGDLTTPQSCVEAFSRYGVDGVMIGRAALGRPWLFAQAAALLGGETMPPDPTPIEQRQLLLDHFRLVVERFGPEKGTVLMRAYACCYGQGRRGARVFRREVVRAETPEDFVAVVEREFPLDPPTK